LRPPGDFICRARVGKRSYALEDAGQQAARQVGSQTDQKPRDGYSDDKRRRPSHAIGRPDAERHDRSRLEGVARDAPRFPVKDERMEEHRRHYKHTGDEMPSTHGALPR